MLHSPTMPSARYSSWHFFFISTGHKTARTHIHPHIVGCELEYASKPYFWHDISRQMSLMHYIPTFPMWWLRRSGVVVCAKRASDLIFRLKLVSPDSFLLLQPQATLSAKCRTLLFTYGSLSTISSCQPSSCQKIGDSSRRYPRQVSLFFFWWESHSRRERSMHVGCGSKLHASSTSSYNMGKTKTLITLWANASMETWRILCPG